MVCTTSTPCSSAAIDRSARRETSDTDPRPPRGKYLKRGCVVGVGDDLRPQLLGDQAGQPFGEPHPHAADALGPQADRRRQHQVRAIGLEQVDRADVGARTGAESG